MEGLERDLSLKEAKVRELGAEISGLWREIVLLRRRCSGMLHLQEEEGRDFSVEFERILALPAVKSVEVGMGFLTVLTKNITLTYQDRVYDLGFYSLEIYLHGYIRVRNLNNHGRYPYYDHPHIRDGQPCLGNVTEAVAKLIAEGQFSVVVSILCSHLESYSPDDAYCDLSYWPEAPRNASEKL